VTNRGFDVFVVDHPVLSKAIRLPHRNAQTQEPLPALSAAAVSWRRDRVATGDASRVAEGRGASWLDDHALLVEV
jgi:hypothetical protein